MTDRLKRINELAALSRTRPLTQEEKREQAALRAEYLAAVRRNLELQLDNTFIIMPDGTEKPLPKREDKQ